MTFAAALATATALASGAVAASPFDGFRYVTEATGAADAPRIAWVENHDGVTTLFSGDGPAFAPEAVARSARDDGQPIGEVAVSADGRWIAWVTGVRSDYGHVTNAASLAAPPRQSVWLAGPDGAPCRLGDGASPSFAPGSDRLLISDAGALRLADLGPGSCEARAAGLRTLVKARTGLSQATWSPGGDAVAFTARRGAYGLGGAYSLVGAVAVAGGAVRWVPSDGRKDVSPAWSPDGRRLAFFRVDAPTNDDATPRGGDADPPARVEAAVFDLTSGKVVTAWRTPGIDGFSRQARGNYGKPLRWLDDDRLLVYSEHEGFAHFYRLTLSTRTLVDLTPGACESEFAETARGGAILLVGANCRARDQRALYRIDTRTGARTLLTPRDGVFSQPVAIDGGRMVVYRGAEGWRPQTARVQALDGDKAVEPAPFTGADPTPDVRVETVRFKASDGAEVEGHLFRSTRTKAGAPAIVYVHGGPARQFLASPHYGEVYARYYWLNRALASRGYVVLSVNYRSGVGEGRDVRRAPGTGPLGAAEYADVLGGARWLQALADVDPQRIGIWGASWGGYLTALALSRNSEVFKAGIDISGVHDTAFETPDMISIDTEFGVRRAEAAEAAKTSPVGTIDRWRSPVLLISGDDDDSVPVEQTIDLAARLRARDVPVEVAIYPDEQHGFVLARTWDDFATRAFDFFERRLKN